MVTGSVHRPSPKVGTGRFLLLHSPVELRSGDRRHRRHLFLFSDLLLISNAKYVRTPRSPDSRHTALPLTLMVTQSVS